MRRWIADIPGVAWVLCAVLPLGQLTISATYPVVPQVREAFSLNYSEVGVYLASLSFARLLCDLPAGQIATRLSGRRLLWVSGLVTFVTCALAALASEYWQLVLARVVIGAASSINQAVILSWLVSLANSRNRGLVMGLSETAFSVMVVFSPLVAGALADALSWRAPFAMGAVAALGAVMLVLLGTRPEPAAASRAAGTTDEAPSFRRLLPLGGPVLVVAFALAHAIFFGRQAIQAVYLPALGADVLGLSPLAVGFALSGISLGGIAATLVGSALADRLGRSRMSLPGLGLLLVLQAPLALIHDVPTFYMLAWLQALSAAVNAVPLSLVGDALPPSYRALGMAGYRLVADVALLLGPLAAGVALDHAGVFGAWGVLWLNTAIAGAIALAVVTRKPTQSARRA